MCDGGENYVNLYSNACEAANACANGCVPDTSREPMVEAPASGAGKCGQADSYIICKVHILCQ